MSMLVNGSLALQLVSQPNPGSTAQFISRQLPHAVHSTANQPPTSAPAITDGRPRRVLRSTRNRSRTECAGAPLIERGQAHPATAPVTPQQQSRFERRSRRAVRRRRGTAAGLGRPARPLARAQASPAAPGAGRAPAERGRWGPLGLQNAPGDAGAMHGDDRGLHGRHWLGSTLGGRSTSLTATWHARLCGGRASRAHAAPLP